MQGTEKGSRGDARLLSFSNVTSLIAIFLALGGGSVAIAALARNSVGSKQIKPGAVHSSDIHKGAVTSNKLADRAVSTAKLANGAVTGAKVLDGSLKLADLDIKVTEVTVSGLNVPAQGCTFKTVSVPGVEEKEGLLAYTLRNWDNRLILTGAESGADEVVLRVCNLTGGDLTNVGGPITLLRFPAS